MKKQINLFKIVMFIIVIGMFFLLPLCACQRKTTTEKITTTKCPTTKTEYKFYYFLVGGVCNDIVFYKENNTLKVKYTDQNGIFREDIVPKEGIVDSIYDDIVTVSEETMQYLIKNVK